MFSVKKKIFLLILFWILLFVTSFYIVYNIFFRIKVDNTGIKYINNLKIEVYSEVFVSDLIEYIDGEIIENKLIDTSSLGKISVEFLYKNKNNRKKLGVVSVFVVDSISPLIFIQDSYTILKGSGELVVDDFMSVDNFDSDPQREIIGNYDSNRVGKYNLTYKVMDNSGNTNFKNFVLKVVDKSNFNREANNNNSYTNFDKIVNKYKRKNSLVGIDISKWQGEIDFEKVKAAGCEFVMIRIGYQDGIDGESVLDPYFERNMKGAISNDLKIGVYYYSYANKEKDAKEQAMWVLDVLSDYEIDLPVVFDWENWKNFNLYKVSLYDINNIADTFLNIIKKSGYRSMLYGSKYYLENIWNVDYKDIWLAHYVDNTDYNDNYMMWQLCSDGKIDGIEGYVDIDVLYL